MQLAIEKIKVTGHNLARIESANFLRAGWKMAGHAVQDRGWSVDEEKITREHVTTEQKIVLRAVKTAVPGCMSGQVYHPQTAPQRQFLSVAQEFVNRLCPVTE